MSLKSIKEIFVQEERLWRKEFENIADFTRTVESFLQEQQDHDTTTIRGQYASLEENYNELLKILHSPEVVLAIAGTTSAGKSTFANFLIGEKILPVDHNEMSAGIVKISHGEKRSLKIPETTGREDAWEVGQWFNLKADDIRTRLRDTMNAFREKRQKNPSLEPVCFEVEWPIRLMQKQEKAQFGLPENARITIVDLPGLNALHDDHNRQIITQHITKALCLVVCNAYDINNETEKKLIQDIVQSVIQLQTASSSVNRMLFIPNRIDAFFKFHNDNNVGALDRFKRRIKEQVCESLRERLPEENESINAIKFDAQICSEPALFAVNAQRTPSREEKIEYIRDISNSYRLLFEKDYWDDVGSIKKLDDSQCDAIIKKTLECSFADEFLRHLKDHITHNLSEIVIGGARNQLYSCFSELRTTLDYSLTAHINWTKEQIDEKKKCLELLNQKLVKESALYKDLLRNIEQEITEIKKQSETQNDRGFHWTTEELYDVCKDIEGFISTPLLLSPLCRLYEDCLARPVKILNDYVEHVLNPENKEEFPDQELAFLPSFDQFSTSLKELQNSLPDINILFEDDAFVPDRDGLARKVQSVLLEFQEVFSIIISEAIQSSQQTSAYRLQKSFQECASHLLTKFQNTCRTSFKEELKEFVGLENIFTREKMVLPTLEIGKVHVSFKFKEAKQESEKSREGFWGRFLDSLLRPKKVSESGIKISSFYQIIEEQLLSNKDLSKCFENYIVSFIERFSQFLDEKIEKNVTNYKSILVKKSDSYEWESKETEQNVQKYKDILSKMDFDLPRL